MRRLMCLIGWSLLSDYICGMVGCSQALEQGSYIQVEHPKQEWIAEIVQSAKDIDKLNGLLLKYVKEAPLNILEILLRNHLNIDIQTQNGDTALLIATKDRNLDKMKLLLEHQANPNILNNRKESVLDFVLDWKESIRTKGLSLLVNYEVDLSLARFKKADAKLVKNLIEQKNKDANYLVLCAQMGQWDELIRLLDKGVNVNSKNNFGYTSLIFAVQYQRLDIIKMLLDKGADVNVRTEMRETALMYALDLDNANIINLLIDKGVNLNEQYRDGVTALMLAVRNGDIKIITKMVNSGADIGIIDEHDMTAFLYAMRYQHWDVMEFLVSCGIDLNEHDRALTASLVAVGLGDIDAIKFLLDHGMDVDVPNVRGLTGLMLASEQGRLDIVKFLVQQGASISKHSVSDVTALMLASGLGHLDVIKYLIKKGSNINEQDKEGTTALMLAAVRGHLNVAEYLIKQGADINVKDEENITALMYAVEKGHLNLVELLINHGSDVNAISSSKDCALIYAINNRNVEIVEALLKGGAKVNIDMSGVSGVTALVLACYMQEKQIVKLLLEAGANVKADVPDGNIEDENLALMSTVCLSNVEILKLLIEAGVDVNTPYADNFTALMRACRSGNLKIVKLLLEAGADVNMKTVDDETALMFAIETGRLAVVRQVLNLLDINEIKHRDKYNRTALHYAVDGGYSDIVECILRKYGTISDDELNEDTLKGCSLLSMIRSNTRMKKLFAKYHQNDKAPKTEKLIQKDQTRLVSETENLERNKSECIQKFDSTFIRYALKGDKQKLEKLLQEKQEMLTEDAIANVLHIATKRGNQTIINCLLDNISNLDLDSLDKDKNTALMIAAQKGYYEIVIDLIANGANIHKQNIHKKSALVLAAENGHKDILAYLCSTSVKLRDVKQAIQVINSRYNQKQLDLDVRDHAPTLTLSQYMNNSAVSKTQQLNKYEKFVLEQDATQNDKDIMQYIDLDNLNRKGLKQAMKAISNKRKQQPKDMEIKNYLESYCESRQGTEVIETEISNLNAKWGIYFNKQAEIDWNDWKNDSEQNHTMFMRIQYLLHKLEQNPYIRGVTMGRAETLKGNLGGLVSRRINDKHRLIYRLFNGNVYVVSLKEHYKHVKRTTKELWRDKNGSFKKKWEHNELVSKFE